MAQGLSLPSPRQVIDIPARIHVRLDEGESRLAQHFTISGSAGGVVAERHTIHRLPVDRSVLVARCEEKRSAGFNGASDRFKSQLLLFAREVRVVSYQSSVISRQLSVLSFRESVAWQANRRLNPDN